MTIQPYVEPNSWLARGRRFAQSRGHAALALLAALWVTQQAVAQDRIARQGTQGEGQEQAKSNAWSPPRLAHGASKPRKSRPAKPSKAPGLASSSGVSGVLNMNKASADQWQIFPSVGPATARKILEHRKRKAFASVQELAQVRGIGKRFMERFSRHLRLAGPTTLAKNKDKNKKRKKEKTKKSTGKQRRSK